MRTVRARRCNLSRLSVSAKTAYLKAFSPCRRAWEPLCSSGVRMAATEPAWRPLGIQKGDDLQLEFTLPTGQSFRWRKLGEDLYTGVIGPRLVELRQLPHDVEYRVLARTQDALESEDAEVLADYFNCSTHLSTLCSEWSTRDPRFGQLYPYFRGARMLRQDPLECLFQFICSSNNHISRIHGMVERLCSTYGTPLAASGSTAAAGAAACAAAGAAEPGVKVEAAAGGAAGGLSFYAFPTLEQLSRASEEALRLDGFGYRAKFITGSVQLLLDKPGGGRQWLHSLRQVPYQEAAEALCTLPGIGPKVAACICLFSLDKHQAIPVDTHVWQLALRHYTPHLRGKALSPKLHGAVQQALEERFGPYAGWAHNTLFIADLAKHQQLLPPHLRAGAAGRRKRGASAGSSDDSSEDEGQDAGASEGEGPDYVPASKAKAKVPKARAPKQPQELGKGKRPTASRARRQTAAAPVAAALTAGAAGGSSEDSSGAAEGGKGMAAPTSQPVPGKRRRCSSSQAPGDDSKAKQQAAGAAAPSIQQAGMGSRRLSITSSSSAQTRAE